MKTIRSPWNKIISLSETEKQELKKLIKIIIDNVHKKGEKDYGKKPN